MSKELTAFIEKLKIERRFATLDEAATKQGIVLPLLSKLGWDTFNIDEVVPEYAVGDRRVDYALRLGNTNKVFIEVKKPSEELERHQDQVLDYSFKQGVKLAALTNGSSWWFYLPLNEGSWEQRKFYTIDIVEQGSEDVASRFFDFLSRNTIETGKAVENAEEVYRSRQKIRIVRETLPQAWDKLVSEADELLIDLLSETTEKICGYKADAELVETFLNENKAKLVLGRPQYQRVPDTRPQKPRESIPTQPKGYTGKTIEGFSFWGARHRVNSWIDLMLELCGLLITRHGSDFDRVLSLTGRKRPYFSHNPDVLRVPRKLDNTKLYVESNLSANSIVKVCLDVLSLFGYSDSELMIESR